MLTFSCTNAWLLERQREKKFNTFKLKKEALQSVKIIYVNSEYIPRNIREMGEVRYFFLLWHPFFLSLLYQVTHFHEYLNNVLALLQQIDSQQRCKNLKSSDTAHTSWFLIAVSNP